MISRWQAPPWDKFLRHTVIFREGAEVSSFRDFLDAVQPVVVTAAEGMYVLYTILLRSTNNNKLQFIKRKNDALFKK